MILRPYKKIKDLQAEIEELSQQIEKLKSDKENDASQGHETGYWCNGCKKLIKERVWSAVRGEYELKFCKLDINCKDREE